MEIDLQGHAALFFMDINRVESMIILQNSNFLAQLITEGMKIAMENFVNQMWMTNVMDPLLPAVTPAFLSTMQAL